MTKSSKATYKKADTFSKLAKTQGYRSRSAIKLLEIQKKDNLIKPNEKVLDLGSSPGGWSQVSKEIVGKNGLIFGVDKKIMQPLKAVHFINKDLENLRKNDFEVVNENILPFDVVLSDIAPNITGISDIDQSNFSIIAKSILSFCEVNLEVNGLMIMKYFLGSSFEKTHKNLGNYFRKIDVFKPESSKKNSKEVYLVCIDFKP